MKVNRFSLLFVLILGLSLQLSGGVGEHSQNDICVQAANGEDNQRVSFTLIPIGTAYARTANCSYEIAAAVPQRVTISGQSICADNGFGYQSSDGIGTPIIRGCADKEGGIRPLRNALYNLTVELEDDQPQRQSYVIDIRDCEFPAVGACGNLERHCVYNDLTLRYDVSTKTLSIASGNNTDEGFDAFREVAEGESINWWEEARCVRPCMGKFKERAFSFLAPIRLHKRTFPTLSFTEVDLKARQPESYILERSINGSAFITAAKLGEDVSKKFTDNTIFATPKLDSGMVVKYRVKTLFEDQDYELSNVRMVYAEKLDSTYLKKISDSNRDELGIPEVSKGNKQLVVPFTAIHRIHFKLILFDSAGEEIAILLNQEMAPGEHYVEYDISELPAGEYTVSMRAGNYFVTRHFHIRS